MQADQAGRVVNHICPIVLSSGSFIALATTLGVQVFDGSGKALKLFWPLPEKVPPRAADEERCDSPHTGSSPRVRPASIPIS